MVFRKFGRLVVSGSRLSSVLIGASSSEAGEVSSRVTAGGGARLKQTERGITLQTLIVTAVLVLVAVGAAVVLVAINRSSSDDFEEAGNIGIEGKCQTWEIHLATLEAAGHGGPEGYGGVFSSNIGCLAPCYWELPRDRVQTPSGHFYTEQFFPGPYFVRNVKTPSDAMGNDRWPFTSKLLYYDDNRAPIADQVRLGVVYKRGTDKDHAPGRNGLSDPPKEGEWVIRRKTFEILKPGTPLTQSDITNSIPTVVKPNWFSYGPDPGNVVATGYTTRPDADEQKRYSWEDESWEVRADPGREVCEIVNVANDDLLVCSSAKDECEYTT